MGVKYKSKGKAQVKTENAHGGVAETSFEGKAVETDGTLIGFRVGHTMNLGNFESAKFEVSVVIPSKLGSVNEDFVRCQQWADSKLAEVVAEAVKAAKEDG